MKYLTVEEIKAAFAELLMEHRDYSEEEAEIAVSDFPDPYNLPYQREEFVEDVKIDGARYEKYATVVNLSICGIEDFPVFCFYTFYRKEDIRHHRVTEYMKARKLFQVDELDMDDFPEEACE